MLWLVRSSEFLHFPILTVISRVTVELLLLALNTGCITTKATCNFMINKEETLSFGLGVLQTILPPTKV